MKNPFTDKWRTIDITVLGAFVVLLIWVGLNSFYTPGTIMYYGF